MISEEHKKQVVSNIDKKLLERDLQRIGEFKGYRKKLLIKCLKDGYEWEASLRNILYNNSGCPRCSNNERITNETIDNYIIKNKKTFKRLGNVKNSKEKVEFECLKDGYKWFTSPSKILLRHQGCPKCGGSLPINNEIIDQQLLDKKKPIKRIGNYTKNTKTKIEWECLKCNFHWYAIPNGVLGNNGCPECKRVNVLCNQAKKLSNEKIDERIKGRTLKRIGNFAGYKDIPIEWECLIDGHRWLTSPGNILNNKSGCPMCKNKNENAIKDLIIRHSHIFTLFKHHKTFKFNKRRYIVDFYIESKNNKYIIEYNGGQHYFPVKYFGGNKTFIKQQLRDQELRDYCKDNNIVLIEIPYYFTDEQREEEINKII